MATFDSMTFFGSHDVGSYTEGGLYIQTPSSWQNFPLLGGGIWYPNAGYNGGNSFEENLALIGNTDGARMFGVEFYAINAGPAAWDTFIWETYRDGSLTDSGTFVATVVDETVIGFADAAGIDELRVGFFNSTSGFVNPIGIDNLRVQNTAIPEPSSLLVVIGLAAGACCRRRAR